MIINHNMNAMNAHRLMSGNTQSAGKAMEKLSSGLRINRAGDDAAGLAISEKMRGQIRGLDQASRNAQDGISFIQTAEGALNETHSILQRMRELSVQSANDTNISVDRGEIQKEVDQLASEITRISNNTEFNQQTLLNGGITADGKGAVKFHIGANEGQDIELSISAMDAKSLGVARDLTKGNLSNNTKISAVQFDPKEVGSNVVDKANLTVSATVTSGTVGTTAVTAGVTLTTADNTDAFNGYTVNYHHAGANGTASASIDNTQRVITINVYEDHKTAADINGAITANDDLKGKFVATGASTLDGSATKIDASGSIGSGAKDSVVVKVSNGTAGDDETVTVKSDATKAVFTGAHYKGITLDLKAGANGLLTANATPGTAGSAATDLAGTISVVQTGAKAATFTNKDLTAKAVAEAGINVSDQSSASSAVTTIQKAIEKVSAERSKLGSYQNRLEHTIANLGTSSENLTAAESRIRDVDMAKEMMNFSKNNILSQAAQAMLAQANQQPQGVLQLLR